jgi:hypothetical protein
MNRIMEFMKELQEKCVFDKFLGSNYRVQSIFKIITGLGKSLCIKMIVNARRYPNGRV